MAENHELRLKIDASAAKRGGREFTAAITAVKQAVRDLERDSTGAFTKLQKNLSSLGKKSKVDIGVSKADVTTLNAFAKAQSQIVSSTASSNKGIKTLVSTMRGLSDSYGMARKTSEAFSVSILKTNSALSRQIQLASQARSAVRQVRTAPISASAPSGDAATASSVRAITAAFDGMNKASRSAGATASSALNTLGKQARLVMRSQTDATNATVKSENVQLSAAAAMRRAEGEAVRLSASLRAIGDTKGATQVSRALIQLKMNMSGGVESALKLRTAMDQFSRVAGKAKIGIAQANAATIAATAENKRLAAAQRATAQSAKQVEAQMRSIAGATNATSQAFSRATGNMRGLENAFSGTFQVGSAFRTMLGSITLGTFTKGMFEAGNALDQFRVTMEVATGSVAGASAEMDYIDGVADRLGTNLQSARDNYSKFAISADIAGVSSDKTRKIFESVSTAMAVLGKGTEDQNLAFMALEQMMSKGTVSSEELRRQLGERLPGAVNIMAQALGVTTAGLQDMLKAGEISSADALPKFADELQKRFGPGLQKATQRAGYSLGTLSNEITKFQETVAQSGFMQVLAQQFSTLTEAMRGDEAKTAAQTLGEGFAYMAEKGGDAAVYLIENMEKIGAVIKGVAGGIVVRQALLMANALATSGQQMMAFLASVAAGTRGQTAAEVATIRHTAAVNANTVALSANAKAAVTDAAAQTTLASSHNTAAAASSRSGKVLLAGATSTRSFGKFIGIAARGLGFLSRALTVVAPVAGIVVTALMVLPALFRKVGDGASDAADDTDDAADRIDAAIRRSGAKFEQLGTSIHKTASNAALATVITDLRTLDMALDTFVRENKLHLASLREASSGAGGDIDPTTMIVQDAKIGEALSGLGLDKTIVDAMSATEKRVFTSIAAMTDKAAQGKISFLELHDAIASAIVQTPGNSAPLAAIRDLTTEAALAEVAASELRTRLVEVYGTDADKAVMNFAKMAKAAVNSGEGFEELSAQADQLKSDLPGVASKIRNIFDEARLAVSRKQSGEGFFGGTQQYWDGAAARIEQFSQRAEQAQRAAADSATNFSSTMENLNSEQFSGEGVGSMLNDREIEQAKSLMDDFQRSMKITVPTSQFETLASSINAPTVRMKEFRDAAIAAYNTVSPTNQSYSTLATTLQNLAKQYNDPSIDRYVQTLLDANNKTGESVLTAQQLEEALKAIEWPDPKTASAEQMIETIMKAARSFEQAENASASASEEMANNAVVMDEINAAAAAATSRVNSLKSALANLASVGAEVTARGDEMISDLELNIKLKSMAATERGAYEFETRAIQELTQARDDAYDEALAGGNSHMLASKALSDFDTRAETVREQAAKLRELAEIEANTVDVSAKPRAAAKGRKAKETDDQKSANKIRDLYDQRELQRGLSEDLAKQITSLEEQANSHMLLANGIARSSDEADRMAQAMRAGLDLSDQELKAVFDKIYAYEQLGVQMEKLANDPVKAWMDSVPDWVEAAQTIEMDAIGGLSSALSEFIQTGKMNFADLASTIAGSMADILADQAVNGLLNKMGRKEGSGLAGLGGGGDQQQQIASGGQQAATLIGTAINTAGADTAARIAAAMGTAGSQVQAQQIQAGAMNATQIQSAEIAGGAQHSAQVQQAIVAGGAQHAAVVGAASAGGGLMSGMSSIGLNPLSLGMMAVGFMSEGGYSNKRAPQTGKVSAATFHNAPQYAEGTANTSGGIPAILHDNEAVVPLSKGRKIPVDLGDGVGGGASVASFTMGDVNVNVEGGDGDGMSAEQAKFLGTQITSTVQAVVETQFAKHLRYGGMLKPRGM